MNTETLRVGCDKAALDVPGQQGRGHGKALVRAVLAHPELQGLRCFTLATADAHGLYAFFGFTALPKPQAFMERYAPGVYASVNVGRMKDRLNLAEPR